MGRYSKVKRNPDNLRRLFSGAVLISTSWIAACGGASDQEVSGPNPPPPEAPVDQGQAPVAGCTDGSLAHGALYRICFPDEWNGDLVLFAHGYIAPQEELALPEDVVGGQSASSLVTGLGYAYATTSYRANGLIAPEAVEDLLELVDTVDARYRPDPSRRVVVGFSEGGLVATLAVERHPDRFDGALTGCGPIGDFSAQLDYIAGFRVVFDYFFPGLLPGDALNIPDALRDRWEQLYVPAIALALAARPDATRQLLNVTQAPVAGDDIRSTAETVVGLLWYNVFGTADAQQRLGGQPYDNTQRVYAGSSDDAALNAGVERYQDDPSAQAGLGRFATTGSLTVPLVNLHTSGDPIVPFSQSVLYGQKVGRAGATAKFTQLDVDRFGHCTFEAQELLGAFSRLWESIGPRPVALRALAR
jgi:pimeloyl-ACP methyl ester carboxylesterase